jgi:hypothetical protein
MNASEKTDRSIVYGLGFAVTGIAAMLADYNVLSVPLFMFAGACFCRAALRLK